MPAASTTTLSVQVLDFEDICPLIQRGRLLCGSCSSGQRFACGFLQILPRGRHPCRPASTSPCRACGGLSPPSECALPGAQKTKLHLPSGEMELCRCSMWRRRASRLLDLRSVSGSTSGTSIRANRCEGIINECAEEVKGFEGGNRPLT
jgi:hypothetical protein